MLSGIQFSRIGLRCVPGIRFFSPVPQLARDRGIKIWAYKLPFLPPVQIEHPFQVPKSAVEAAPKQYTDYIETGFGDNAINGMDTHEELNVSASGEEAADVMEDQQNDEQPEQELQEEQEEQEDSDAESDNAVLEEGWGENFAVVDINTKQVKVSEGALVMTDRLKVDVGEQLIFDRLLLIGTPEFTLIGRPLIVGKVYATVEAHDETEKLIVFKKKRRKTYQRQYYHSSLLTLLRIDRVEFTHEAPAESEVVSNAAEARVATVMELKEQEDARRRKLVPTLPKPSLARMDRINMNRKLRAERDRLLYVSKAAKAKGSRRSKTQVQKLYPEYLERKKKIIEKYTSRAVDLAPNSVPDSSHFDSVPSYIDNPRSKYFIKKQN